jgi:hypothetical protein
MKSIFNINPDAAGFVASLLCAIHCSALPILISLGLIGTNSLAHNHMVDWVVIGLGILIASYSLIGDYIKSHRNLYPLTLAAIGFIFLLVGMIDHHGWMLIFSVTGGLIVATSHIINHYLGKACTVKL